MTPRSWIEMGDELRGELDNLEHDLWFYVVGMTNGDADLSRFNVRTIDTPKVEAKLLALFKGRDSEWIEEWWADGLAKLRSHGRCLDWPEEPWSAKS